MTPDCVSHSTSNCLEILFAQPSEYAQNLTTFHFLLCFHPGSIIIICCLDYCSYLLTSLTPSISALLQPILNTETREVLCKVNSHYIAPLLKTFQSSEFPSKVKAKVLHSPTKAPYLSDLISWYSSPSHPPSLHSIYSQDTDFKHAKCDPIVGPLR